MKHEIKGDEEYTGEDTPLQRAKRKYEHEKRFVKRVVFNRDKDADLIEAAQSIENFSVWVKEKIKEHVKQQDTK